MHAVHRHRPSTVQRQPPLGTLLHLYAVLPAVLLRSEQLDKCLGAAPSQAQLCRPGPAGNLGRLEFPVEEQIRYHPGFPQLDAPRSGRLWVLVRHLHLFPLPSFGDDSNVFVRIWRKRRLAREAAYHKVTELHDEDENEPPFFLVNREGVRSIPEPPYELEPLSDTPYVPEEHR